MISFLFYTRCGIILRAVFIALLIFSIPSRAQLSYPDSLKRNIYCNLQDTLIIKDLQILFQYYTGNDLDSARKYANLCLELGFKHNKKRITCVSYANLAELESLLGNYTAQIKYLSKALEIMQGSKDREGTMRINMRLCDAFIALNDTTNTLLHLKKVKEIYNTLDEKSRKLIFSRMNHHMAMISIKRRDGAAALQYIDSALSRKEVQKITWLYGKLLQTKAEAYSTLNNLPKAREFYLKAINVNESINAHSAAISCKEGLAALLLKQNSPDSALSVIKQAELAAMKMNNSTVLLSVYDRFIQVYDKLGKHEKKAQYLALKLELKDSLNAVSFNQALADAQVALKNYEKETENKLLNEQNKVLELEVKNSRGLLFMIIFAAVFVVLILFVWTRYQKLKIAKSTLELEHKLLRSQMNPHFMFNSLSTIQSFVLSENPLKAAKYISLFSALMRKTLENSQRDYILLEEEVSTLKTYMELEGIRMNMSFNFSLDYNQGKIGHLFVPPMLVQPYLENAIKHGLKNLPNDRMGDILLVFKMVDDSLVCSITDNGIGYKAASDLKQSEPSVHQSSGIEITKKRLQLLCVNLKLKYHFKISDRSTLPGNFSGTIVEFNLPYKNDPKSSDR